MTTLQQQYISEWHDNFVNFIGGLLSFVESLIVLPEATDEDKRAFDQIKLMLNGKDAKDIESTLANGTVRHDTLYKIEKLYKDLVDISVERIKKNRQVVVAINDIAAVMITAVPRSFLKEIKDTEN